MGSTERIRILLVEDNPGDECLVRATIREHFASATVSLARDRASFVRRLRHSTYDCVVIDYHVPDGRADEMLQVMQLIAPETPAIVISGSSDQGVARQALRNGAADFVNKSGTMTGELASRINRVVTLHGIKARAAGAAPHGGVESHA